MSDLYEEEEFNLDGWSFCTYILKPYQCHCCPLNGLDKTGDMKIGVSTGPPASNWHFSGETNVTLPWLVQKVSKQFPFESLLCLVTSWL